MIKDKLEILYEERKSLIWLTVFILLCLLYLDLWNWEKITPIWFGLPFWIVYHIVLTVFTGMVFYLFVLSVWRNE